MQSVGYDGKLFELVDKNGNPVNRGDSITNFRGEATVLDSARPPHKPSSTGHVNSSYAGVYGLKWVEVEVRDSYDDGLCPDCGDEIPSGFVSQDSCENCGHVLFV